MTSARTYLPALAVAVGLLPAGQALAVDILPGDYVWPGDGVNFLLLYGQHQRAKSLDLDGVGTVPDSKLTLNMGLLRGVTYHEIGGQKLGFQFILPFGNFADARIGGADQPVSNGIGDLIVAASWWPVVSADPQGTTLGFTAYLTTPTGNHDPGHVSIGSDTWTLTPQVGLVQGLGQGWFIDAALDASFSRDKTDDGVTASSDPSWQFQAYARYQVSPTTNFAIGYSGKRGGKQFSDDVYTGLKTESDQLRLTASTFLNEKTQLYGMIGKDFNTEGGFENDVIAQVRLGFLF